MPELDGGADGGATPVSGGSAADGPVSAGPVSAGPVSGDPVGGGAAETASIGDRDQVDETEVAALADALAGVVTSTSGVLRVEPTLRGAVHAWRSGDGDDPAQHVEVTVRGRMVDVSVHLAVSADQQARLLAHRLRDRLRTHLRGRGLEPGSVEISILVIEPALS